MHAKREILISSYKIHSKCTHFKGNNQIFEGKTGFQLKIPYLEYAFSTKYFIMDRVTGTMMGIYDDKVEQIDLKGQLKPFNINQLDRVMHIIGQRRLGLDTSSIPTDEIPEDSHRGQSSNRIEYPSTPKKFNLFQEYKNIEHDGDMLMAEQRTKMYEDRSKVIAEMADAFYIFSRSIFFNPEMVEQYNHSCGKYINYFMQIVQNIDIFLQEDQLMHTKAGFHMFLFQVISLAVMTLSRQTLIRSSRQQMKRLPQPERKCR